MLFDVSVLGKWGNVGYHGGVAEPYLPRSQCEAHAVKGVGIETRGLDTCLKKFGLEGERRDWGEDEGERVESGVCVRAFKWETWECEKLVKEFSMRTSWIYVRGRRVVNESHLKDEVMGLT